MIVYIIWAIICWGLWNIIHETSHILAAKLLGDVKSWLIKPYPHYHEGKLRYSGAYWTWRDDPPSKKNWGLINLAPRIANLFAMILLIMTFFLTGTDKVLLLIFCAGGMIDLIIGSIGTETSDLQAASRRLEMGQWPMRIVGITSGVCGLSVILTSLL